MTDNKFTQNTNTARMKRRDWAMIVCVAIVDAPRIIDSYIGLHGGKVGWELWPTVHGLTGLGMACIAGLSIAQCLSALAPGRATENTGTRNLLMVLTVAAILALGLQVLPPILGAPAEGLWRVVWAVSAVASPLLVVAATPVAHTLEQAQEAQPAQPVIDTESLRNEWRADIARIERKQTLQAVQVNVSNSQPAQPEPQLSETAPVVAQLASGNSETEWPTWAKQAVLIATDMQATTGKVNATAVSQQVGKSRTAVTPYLVQAGLK